MFFTASLREIYEMCFQYFVCFDFMRKNMYHFHQSQNNFLHHDILRQVDIEPQEWQMLQITVRKEIVTKLNDF